MSYDFWLDGIYKWYSMHKLDFKSWIRSLEKKWRPVLSALRSRSLESGEDAILPVHVLVDQRPACSIMEINFKVLNVIDYHTKLSTTKLHNQQKQCFLPPSNKTMMRYAPWSSWRALGEKLENTVHYTVNLRTTIPLIKLYSSKHNVSNQISDHCHHGHQEVHLHQWLPAAQRFFFWFENIRQAVQR